MTHHRLIVIFYYIEIFDYFFLHKKVNSYSVMQSVFSRTSSYQNFFYYPSTFFGTLLPFVLLSILNGFLIWTVRKSHKMRHAMTNTRQVMNFIDFIRIFKVFSKIKRTFSLKDLNDQ